MTENDWLNSTDPQDMLAYLRQQGRLSERKARLFAVACCRRIWHLLTDERSRRAVEALEGFSDQAATTGELRLSASLAEAAAEEWGDAYYWGTREQAAIVKGAQAAPTAATGTDESRCCQLAAEAVGHMAGAAVSQESHAFKKWRAAKGTTEETLALAAWAAEGDRAVAAEVAAVKAEKENQSGILYDVFGSPFHPPPLVPASVLHWNQGLVRQLAKQAYDQRQLPSGQLDNVRLAVLADALLEAGCDDADIIGHLRGLRPHWRGCHVLDALLGKE